MKLDIVVGDLFDISCDALVNPTDKQRNPDEKKCGYIGSTEI